jgi:hypothetical protein
MRPPVTPPKSSCKLTVVEDMVDIAMDVQMLESERCIAAADVDFFFWKWNGRAPGQ